MEEILRLDDQVLLFINGLHTPFFDIFMSLASQKFVWIPLYVALFYAMVCRFGWRKALYGLLAIAVTITISDQLSSSLIRPWVGRLRPANLDNPLSVAVHVVDGYRGGRYGFPSSHASNTAGLTFFIVNTFRRRMLTRFMIVWMLLVCYSRMYLGVHFLGDLLVGGIIGFAIAMLSSHVYLRLCHENHRNPDDSAVTVRSYWSVILVGAFTILAFLLYAAILRLWGG